VLRAAPKTISAARGSTSNWITGWTIWRWPCLVASTRGLALMPAYAKNLLPWSVVSRPLEGQAPTIDLAVGYTKSNTSPILQLFLSRLDKPTNWWAEPEVLTPRITSPPEGQLLRGSLTRYVVTYTARSTLGEDVLMTDYTEIG
jgi:hypothetical protein